MNQIKLAYIGGGSKAWARVFMNDLALTEGLCGEIALYDIDLASARRNQAIGNRLNEHPDTVSHWTYTVYERLEDALSGADFVACSILPGTFDEMESDVHLPEAYGIYQSVGDTVGPGGVLRAMRTVPIYEGFAETIARICPNAWILNMTNPMTACTKTLFDVFPKIKAFGCCHEVFGTQNFLCDVAKEELGIPRPDRREIEIDVSGINHFTWITSAHYHGTDLLALLPGFIKKYYEIGYPQDFMGDPFRFGNKVKMDLFLRFGALAAAGDRHLVEFLNNRWYITDEATAESWLYHLTPVSYRKADQKKKIEVSERLASGKEPVVPKRSNEEAVEMMKALVGMGSLTSNANTVNRGQAPDLPVGSIVETNCLFEYDRLTPCKASPLPLAVLPLVARNAMNIEALYDGIKHRDLDVIFESFLNQPLCSALSADKARELFRKMVTATSAYLEPYYDLSRLK